MEKHPKIMISVITGEYARRADFYDYYNLLIKPPDTYVILCHDRSPAHGRNVVIEAAIENNCSHILFIDDDMAYKPDSLVKLLEHDVDIVSGMYFTRSYPAKPLVFDIADDDGSCLPVYLTGEEPRLIEIVAAGLGFCLIKTKVFQELDKPWFRLGELDPEQWCDDIGFFNRVRKADIKVYCDTEVLCGHMGTMIVWPEKDADGAWYAGYDTNGSTRLRVPASHPHAAKYQFKEE